MQPALYLRDRRRGRRVRQSRVLRTKKAVHALDRAANSPVARLACAPREILEGAVVAVVPRRRAVHHGVPRRGCEARGQERGAQLRATSSFNTRVGTVLLMAVLYFCLRENHGRWNL